MIQGVLRYKRLKIMWVAGKPMILCAFCFQTYADKIWLFAVDGRRRPYNFL